MKFSLWMILCGCIVIATLIAGCTSQPAKPVVTTTTTPLPTTNLQTPVPAVTPISDQNLTGIWFLQQILYPSAPAPLVPTNSVITASFDMAGNLAGNGGCNQYSGTYTLTGKVVQGGNGMTVSPLVTTLMFCDSTSGMEQSYLQVLQNTTNYLINPDQSLVLTDKLGSKLVYSKTQPPGAPTAVPRY